MVLGGPTGLRALPSYAGTAALLAATVAVLAAATTLAVALTDGAGGRAATVLPLLVVALVVVPVPAVELARRRRPVTTLVRVSGAGESRLLATTGGPGALAALVGGAVGIAAAVALAPVLPGSWDAAPSDGVVWAAGCVAGAVLLTLACARVVALEPLAGALRRPVRTARPAAGLVRLVATVAVLVAAAAAAYLALAADPSDDAGPLVLAGAGVVALAAGELLVRALGATAPLAEAPRSTGVLLGLRRAGAPDAAPRLRAAVAAGVVVAAALSATLVAQDWADTTERVRLGAPLQVDLPDAGAVEALQLTRRADPDGRWLMAGAVSDERNEAELRVVRLDLARFERVAGGFLAGTPAGPGEAVAALTDAPAVAVVTGEDLTATVAGAADVQLTYLDPAGLVATATLRTAVPTAAVDCADGCVVLSLSATAPADLEALALDGTDLLAAGWAPPDGPALPTGPLELTDAVLTPAAAQASAPVLTAGSPAWDDGARLAGVGGVERSATVVGTRAALPVVGAAGVLADLPVALAGAGAQGNDVRTVVLARADTPDDVLAVLTDAGAEPPRRLDDTPDALGPSRAAELRARTVVALTTALLGALVLLTGARRRADAERHDRAALRLVGLDPRELRTAALVEAGVLGGAATVAVAVGGLAVALLVSPGAGLVPTGPALLDLGPAVSAPALAAASLGAGVLTALVSLLTRRGGVRASAPATLLDEAAP